MKIFDIHMYMGKSLYQKDFYLENVEELRKNYSLATAGIIATKPYEYDYAKPNKELSKIANENSLYHILRVDPWRSEQAIEIIKQSSSSVLFIHFFEEQIYPTNPLVKEVIEEAHGRNMKIMLACGYLPFSHSAQVFPLIKSFPKVPFIITHGGQINISGMHMAEAFELFSLCENTFFETSGIYREDYIEEAINKIGYERVVFGSGTPYYYFPYEVKRIEHLNVTNTVKEKIFFQNAKNIFDEKM